MRLTERQVLELVRTVTSRQLRQWVAGVGLCRPKERVDRCSTTLTSPESDWSASCETT